MAGASVFIMNLDGSILGENILPMQSHINVGSGSDISISELSNLISHAVGYKGAIEFDTSRPDGSPQKLMDSRKIQALGWRPLISLAEGLQSTYADYCARA
jgi:nucleoside-diphosphate-sugar epimerase